MMESFTQQGEDVVVSEITIGVLSMLHPYLEKIDPVRDVFPCTPDQIKGEETHAQPVGDSLYNKILTRVVAELNHLLKKGSERFKNSLMKAIKVAEEDKMWTADLPVREEGPEGDSAEEELLDAVFYLDTIQTQPELEVIMELPSFKDKPHDDIGGEMSIVMEQELQESRKDGIGVDSDYYSNPNTDPSSSLVDNNLPDIQSIQEKEREDRESTKLAQEHQTKSSTATPAKIDLGRSMKCLDPGRQHQDEPQASSTAPLPSPPLAPHGDTGAADDLL